MTTLAHLIRRTSVVLLAGVLLLAASGPAGADVPEGWETPDGVDPAQAVLLLGGVPLLAMLVITLLVLGTNRRPGDRTAASGAIAEDHWFGGPRQGTAELAAPAEDDSTSGGASARW